MTGMRPPGVRCGFFSGHVPFVIRESTMALSAGAMIGGFEIYVTKMK
jgi:hypothetical protein